MSSQLFLKIAEISGESRDACHQNEIELLAFRSAGNAISVTKKIDSTSPHLPEVVLTLRSGGDTFVYKLTDVLIEVSANRAIAKS